MGDIFARITAVLLAVSVFFGIPLVYMHERAKSARQLYMLSEVTRFVDGVCNVGVIDRDMIGSFYDSMSKAGSGIKIQMLHETYDYVFDEESDRYVTVKRYYDESDITKAYEYRLYRGDYFRVSVEAHDDILFLMQDDATLSVVYGGTVKYEDF